MAKKCPLYYKVYMAKMSPYNPMCLPKPDRDMYFYLHGRGEFGVDADISHEKKLNRIEKFKRTMPDFMKVILKRGPVEMDRVLARI